MAQWDTHGNRRVREVVFWAKPCGYWRVALAATSLCKYGAPGSAEGRLDALTLCNKSWILVLVAVFEQPVGLFAHQHRAQVVHGQ